MDDPHRVFAYGTLRQVAVQEALYGRRIRTVPDSLPGYRLEWLRITDPDVISMSRTDQHPILRPGDANDSVEGAYLELTEQELMATDEYEVDDYVRRAVKLSAGLTAWVYLGA